MLPTLALVAIAFAFLFLVRLGGARRDLLSHRWVSVLLALVGAFALARGALRPAIFLGVLAALAWFVLPVLLRPSASAHETGDPRDSEARRILGVRAGASEAEIRAAYRRKMARAHPDRGGAHNDAARLTEARDRLLKR